MKKGIQNEEAQGKEVKDFSMEGVSELRSVGGGLAESAPGKGKDRDKLPWGRRK